MFKKQQQHQQIYFSLEPGINPELVYDSNRSDSESSSLYRMFAGKSATINIEYPFGMSPDDAKSATLLAVTNEHARDKKWDYLRIPLCVALAAPTPLFGPLIPAYILIAGSIARSMFKKKFGIKFFKSAIESGFEGKLYYPKGSKTSKQVVWEADSERNIEQYSLEQVIEGGVIDELPVPPPPSAMSGVVPQLPLPPLPPPPPPSAMSEVDYNLDSLVTESHQQPTPNVATVTQTAEVNMAQLLEERLILGEISEQTYLDLKQKYSQ